MNHCELLAKIDKELEVAIFESRCGDGGWPAGVQALRAIVEMHKPCSGEFFNIDYEVCGDCSTHNYAAIYPCLTIQAIEKELA